MQQLEHLVEAGGVRHARRADGERPVESRDEVTGEKCLARAHPVAVALHGVDFTVVGDEAVRVCERPRREGVRGETAVHQRQRGFHALVRQVGEELLEFRRGEHSLVDEGASRQGGEVGAHVTRQFVLDPLAHDEQPAVEVDAHGPRGVIHEVGAVSSERIAALSGPNLATEIAAGQPAATTIACRDESVAGQVQRACAGPTFRPYTTDDVVGTEIGGAAKNIVAVAAGIAIGMGFGENTQAALITRGLAEIARLGMALGADPMTFSGLAGMGDLVASCGSPLSRNRTFGEVLGQTQSMESAIARVAKTVEGVSTSRAALELAHRVGVEVPIIEAVADVVAGTITPRDAFKRIMQISTKAEGFK